MTEALFVLDRRPDLAELSTQSRLLASYGMAVSRRAVAEAFSTGAGGPAWLTFSRDCVPVLSLLAPRWAPEVIGAFASLAGRAPLRRACGAAGFPLAESAAFTVEGCVWDGAFEAGAVHPAPAPLDALLETARALCRGFGVSRAYLRLETDGTGRRVYDAQVTPGGPDVIALARQGGFCPIWAALCVATGRRPHVLPLGPSRSFEATVP